MPATSAVQGKTAFIKEFLFDHPKASSKAVNEAWVEAGMEGTISGTLLSRLKSELGVNSRGRKKAKRAVAPPTAKGKSKRAMEATVVRKGSRLEAPEPPGKPVKRKRRAPATPQRNGIASHRAGDRLSIYYEIEAEIDRLIFSLMSVGGTEEIQEMLRASRRAVVRSMPA